MELLEIKKIGASLVDEFMTTLKKETKKKFKVLCVIDTKPIPPSPKHVQSQQFLFSVTYSLFPPEGDLNTCEIIVKTT